LAFDGEDSGPTPLIILVIFKSPIVIFFFIGEDGNPFSLLMLGERGKEGGRDGGGEGWREERREGGGEGVFLWILERNVVFLPR
jgi:hypothetical protein